MNTFIFKDYMSRLNAVCVATLSVRVPFVSVTMFNSFFNTI